MKTKHIKALAFLTATAAAVLFHSAAQAGYDKETNAYILTKGEVIAIVGVIKDDGAAIEIATSAARIKAERDALQAKLSDAPKEQQVELPAASLDLLIDSPGGDAVAMQQITAAMDWAKAQGVELNCLVHGLAASAAFTVLADCSHRYALPKALMLFHQAKVTLDGQGAAKAGQLQEVANELNALNEELLKFLSKHMHASVEKLRPIFNAERFLTVKELQSIAGDDFIQEVPVLVIAAQ